MSKRLKMMVGLVIPLLLCAARAGAEPGAAERERQPNILWIVSEDNDPFLGCYGDKFAHTPNLDKLAAEGVRYTHAFANAPVCAPSRSTLITGVYASTTGTLHMRSRYPIPPEIHFYSTMMREAGYYVMNPGKTDYNIAANDKATWDKGKMWSDAPAGKPWMLVLNNATSHESILHGTTVHEEYLKEPFTLPPYHPDTPEIRSNWVEYYHKITKMDEQFGAILNKLEKDGLADDTIVFYYSDHGGILPRSKRYVYDSGLRVPLIIRFGKHFQYLAPASPGSTIDRLVAFVDFAPSLISLAGGKMPAQFQGQAFLGPQTGEERKYVFAFRGRMDERIDLSYSIRDARYRYVHNYYPHLPQGQHHDYLWKMPAMVSWEKAYLAGKCDAVQSAFFLPKASEELYDEQADPYEIKNLAADPAQRERLAQLRAALDEQMLKNRDAGLLPESDMVARAKGEAVYSMTHDGSRYPYERVKQAADVASMRDGESVTKLVDWTKDTDPAVRYWAAIGFSVRAADVKEARESAAALVPLLTDAGPAVRVAAAEALCRCGKGDQGLPVLVESLSSAGSDVLYALNALESLGDLAKPAADAIVAKVKAGLPGKARANGESGERYTDLAAKELLQRLGK